MKRIVTILLAAACLFLAGCGQTVDDGTGHGALRNSPSGDVVEIKEKLFIAQTNDIYLNAEDYLGKTIKYEGIYKVQQWDTEDPEVFETYHYVIRYGPGCCGYDGEAGFEVFWDGSFPQVDDWVEAEGILESYEDMGWNYLRLRLTSLTVKEERGAETVTT